MGEEEEGEEGVGSSQNDNKGLLTHLNEKPLKVIVPQEVNWQYT